MLKSWIQFLGRKVIIYLTFGVIVGLFLFGIELAFAYALQLFLAGLGISNGAELRIPFGLQSISLSMILLGILTLTLFRSVLMWMQVYLQGAAHEQFKFIQRQRLLAWCFHQSSVSATETNVLFNERTNLSGNAVMYLQAGVVQVTSSVFMVLSLFWLSPKVSLYFVLPLAVVGAPLAFIAKRIRKSGSGLGTEWDRLTRLMVLSIKNLLLLRIYGMTHSEEEKAQENLQSYLGHSLTYYRMSGLLFALPQFFGMLVVCIIAYASRVYFKLPAGLLLSYFYLFFRAVQSVSAISTTASVLIYNWPQVESLKAWWGRALQFEGHEKSKSVALGEELGRPIGWSLDRVSFSYEPSKMILKDFDLRVIPGSCVVIFGPSGAGKSTLLNLILGELDPTSGQINLDVEGVLHPVREGLATVVDRIGYVGPESFLFEGTVRENLLYGLRRSVSEAELQEALLLAECSFIFDLKGNLEHFISEQGQGLSAGQKQRICLARAILRQPRALILDEATSNLDLDTEAKLIDTLKRLKGQMSIIAVTHRPAMVELADQEVRLDTVKQTDKTYVL